VAEGSPAHRLAVHPLSAVVLLQPKMYDNFRQFSTSYRRSHLRCHRHPGAVQLDKKPVLNLLLIAVLVALESTGT